MVHLREVSGKCKYLILNCTLVFASDTRTFFFSSFVILKYLRSFRFNLYFEMKLFFPPQSHSMCASDGLELFLFQCFDGPQVWLQDIHSVKKKFI